MVLLLPDWWGFDNITDRQHTVAECVADVAQPSTLIEDAKEKLFNKNLRDTSHKITTFKL